MMAGFGSISETGAKAGDRVRCVESNDPRYEVGEEFDVILNFGRAAIQSRVAVMPSREEQRRGVLPYCFALSGFGARWVVVEDAET